MIILPGETDHAIKDLTVLDNLFIATHGKSWTDEYQMGFWYEKLRLTYERESKRNRFLQVLNSLQWLQNLF